MSSLEEAAAGAPRAEPSQTVAHPIHSKEEEEEEEGTAQLVVFQKSVALLEQALAAAEEGTKKEDFRDSSDLLENVPLAQGEEEEEGGKATEKARPGPWRGPLAVGGWALHGLRSSLSRTWDLVLKAAVGLDASPTATKYLSYNLYPLVGSLVANSVSGTLKVLAVCATALFTAYSIFMFFALIVANRRRLQKVARSTSHVLGLCRYYQKSVVGTPPSPQNRSRNTYVLESSPLDDYLPNLEFLSTPGARKTSFRNIRSQGLEESVAKVAKLVADALSRGGPLEALRKTCTAEFARKSLDKELEKLDHEYKSWQINASNSPFVDHDFLFDELQDTPMEAHELQDLSSRLAFDAPEREAAEDGTLETANDQQRREKKEHTSSVRAKKDNGFKDEVATSVTQTVSVTQMTPFEVLRNENEEVFQKIEDANTLYGTPEGHGQMARLLCKECNNNSKSRKFDDRVFPSMLSFDVFVNKGSSGKPFTMTQDGRPRRIAIQQYSSSAQEERAKLASTPLHGPPGNVSQMEEMPIVEIVDMVELYTYIDDVSTDKDVTCARQSLLWLCQFHWSIFVQIIASEDDLLFVRDSIAAMKDRLLPNGVSGARRLLESSTSTKVKDEFRQRMIECAIYLHRKAIIEMIQLQDLEQAQKDLLEALEIFKLRYGDSQLHVHSYDGTEQLGGKLEGACLHHLAMVKEHKRELNEAIRLYRESLALTLPMSENEGYELDYELATRSSKTIHQLAGVYAQKGLYDDAVRCYEYCQEMKIRLFGWDHLSTANTLHFYGWAREMQGQYWDALKAYEEALEISQDGFSWRYKEPSSEVEILTSSGALKEMALHKALGLIKAKQGFEKAAQDSFDKAYYISARMFGKGHPHSRKLANLKHTSSNLAVIEKPKNTATASLQYHSVYKRKTNLQSDAFVSARPKHLGTEMKSRLPRCSQAISRQSVLSTTKLLRGRGCFRSLGFSMTV